ncbi:hypothetical protein D3C71_1681940 [compost metagenome]
MKITHFIVGHHLHIMLQKVQGEKLTANIEHKASYFVFWIIMCLSLQDQAMCRILFQQLQNSSGRPKSTFIIGGTKPDVLINIHRITFLA